MAPGFASPSVLIIADPADTGGLRVAAALRRQGIPLILISTEQLLLAPGWSHDPMAGTEIALGNGVTLSNGAIGAVFCRIRGVDPPQFDHARMEDRIYAQEEFYSLLLSWLEQLGPKVHNRPHAGNLSGERGAALEDRLWLAVQGAPSAPFAAASSARRLPRQAGAAAAWYPGQDEAALAGLPFAPLSETFLAGRPAVRVTVPRVTQARHIVVVGDRTIGEDLNPRIEAQAVAYARSRNLTIAGIAAQDIEGGRVGFCGLDPTPDLTDPRAVEAVCELLLGTLARQACLP